MLAFLDEIINIESYVLEIFSALAACGLRRDSETQGSLISEVPISK